jgi:hypothetical protein
MSSHLLDTAIGGIIALAGTGVAQWFGFFSSKVERKTKHAVLQRERLERISDCVAECVEWSQVILTKKSIAEIRDTHLPAGTRRMVMMAKIHFPNSGLVLATSNFANELIQYQVLAITSFRKDAPPGTTIGQMLYLDPAKMKPIDDKQLILRNRLDDAIAIETIRFQPEA